MGDLWRAGRATVRLMVWFALVALLFPFLGLAQEATIAPEPENAVDPVTVLSVLLAVSEVLALIPGVAANGWLHAIALALRALKGRSALPVLLLCLLAMSLTACSKDNLKANTEKIHAVAVKVSADAKRVEVAGCAAMPTVDVALDLVRDFLPEGATTDDINRSVAVAEKAIGPLCAKVIAKTGQ